MIAGSRAYFPGTLPHLVNGREPQSASLGNRFGNRTPAFYLSLAVLLLGTAFLQAGNVPQSNLALEISSTSVPPGAMAQVRIMLARPHQLASGRIIMDFDPAVFGTVAAVDVFSATGDQIGVANIRGRHVDAQFSSFSGGVGRLPGMPIVTVTVPTLASAAPGVMGSITLATGDTPWKDALGYQYLPAAQPGQMKLGGSLSVDSVTPGGGLLPAGFKIRIAGRGFAASTAVEIEGVVIASTAFAGPQAIDVLLGAPAELTGKRVVVRNPDGAQADFYSALRGSLDQTSSGLLIQPIFPLRTYAGALIGRSGTWFAVQNQNLEPVDVAFVTTSQSRLGTSVGSSTFTVPAGGIHMEGPTNGFFYDTSVAWSIYPRAPIRMMVLGQAGQFSGDNLVNDEFPSLAGPVVPLLDLRWDPAPPSCSVDPFLGLVPKPNCLAWLVGSSPPAPLVLTANTSGPPTGFTTAVTTSDGGHWLSVSPAQGITCSSTACPGKITLKVDPILLAPGEYTGTLTVTPADPIYLPQRIELVFRVTTSIISVEGPLLQFLTDPAHTPPPPLALQVTSTQDPAPFSVSLRIQQEVWGNWVSVSPTEGATPATLNVTANPSAFATGQIGAIGYITITGPANSVTLMVNLGVRQPQKLQMYTSARDAPLIFWTKAGTTTPITRSVGVSPFLPDSVTVATDRGGAWLAAPVPRDFAGIPVSVDPTGLSAGVYNGTITVASTAHPDYAPAQVAVTLVIWAEPPPVSVAPASLVISVPSGSYSSNDITLTVTSSGTPVDSTATAMVDGNDWLRVLPPLYYVPYGGVSLEANARNLPPGTYQGSVKITAPPDSPNSVTIPVTLNVTPAVPPLPQAGPPLGVSIVNGASLAAGAVAPGEILSIFGLNIGPGVPAGLSLDADGKVAANLKGFRILFNNVPAPLLYASATQVNAVVPYEVEGKASVTIQVEFNGTPVTVGGVPVAAAAPAIFTSNATGDDQANAVNEDGSSNGPENPAARGSIIRILATGGGQTTPPSVTGEITREDVKKPVLPVSVKIGGTDATLEDFGSAQGQVAGVLQLKVRVPQGVAPGAAVPVVLMAGSVRSRDGVTIAVK